MNYRLRCMALREALGEILSTVPYDLSEQSAFMAWYVNTSGSAEMPDDMVVWEPFEGFSDERLRLTIGDAEASRFNEYKEIFEIVAVPVRELGAAIEKGDPQTIANLWLGLKPVVGMDIAIENEHMLQKDSNPQKIVVVMEGGQMQSVLAGLPGLSVAVIEYDKHTEKEDQILVPQDDGSKALAHGAIYVPELINTQRLDELHGAVETKGLNDTSYEQAVKIACAKGRYSSPDEKTDSIYTGTVMGITGRHVVVSGGRSAVILEKSTLDVIPEKDKEAAILFRGGRGTVKVAEKGGWKQCNER